jgi:hypothetical protein
MVWYHSDKDQSAKHVNTARFRLIVSMKGRSAPDSGNVLHNIDTILYKII